MATITSPITPEVVRWAVDEDGRSEVELAELLDVEEETFDSWIRGDAQPTVGQLSDLAEVLRRPRAVFFLPRPPATSSLPSDLRRTRGSDEPLSFAARRAFRRAIRVQSVISWTRRQQPPVELPRATQESDPATVGRALRAWVGVTVDRQLAWTTDSAALNAWRSSLDQRGVLTMQFAIGAGDVRGLCRWDDRAPLIVLNQSSNSPAVRSFTIAHELGHLALRSSSACADLSPAAAAAQPGVERWCERVAAELLMPVDAVSRALGGVSADRNAGLPAVTRVASALRVSGRSACLRLIELEYAPRSLYAVVDRTFVVKQKSSDQTPRMPRTSELRVREFGPATLGSVLRALPSTDALSVLGLTVAQARELSERVPGADAV